MEELIADNELIDQDSPRYVIHIENFEGPLDLLWDLIKKSKIDITEITISHITEQYINYLKLMENLNVRVATEFIWMASELLFYKSKALLPSEKMEDEYFVPPLPPELIQKLLEYKRYQQTAQDLGNKYDIQNNLFIRTNNIAEIVGQEDYVDVSLFDLLKAFADVIESMTVIEQEEIIFDEILVSDRIEHITQLLKEQEIVLFADIFSAVPSRAEIIATFLAMLEMTRMKIIRVVQQKTFADIRLVRNFSLDELPSKQIMPEEY